MPYKNPIKEKEYKHSWYKKHYIPTGTPLGRNKTGEYYKCNFCGKQFYRLRTWINKGIKIYCSSSCWGGEFKRRYMTGEFISFTKGTHVQTNTGKTHFKKGERIKEKHWNWKGGITSENTRIRNSIEYGDWRSKILKRDDYTCQMCGQRGGKLNVDHIKPFSLFPSERLNLENGRTLCVSCHQKTSTFAGKINSYT